MAKINKKTVQQVTNETRITYSGQKQQAKMFNISARTNMNNARAMSNHQRNQ